MFLAFAFVSSPNTLGDSVHLSLCAHIRYICRRRRHEKKKERQPVLLTAAHHENFTFINGFAVCFKSEKCVCTQKMFAFQKNSNIQFFVLRVSLCFARVLLRGL